MPEVTFRVTSFDPRKSPGAMVSELTTYLPELNEDLRRTWNQPGLTLEADRQKSIPIDPQTAYLVIKVVGEAAVAGATIMATGFLKKLGEDIYEKLKDRVKNGSIEPPEPPPAPPTTH